MLGLTMGLTAMAAVGLAGPAQGAADPAPDPTKTYIVNCLGDLDFKPEEIVLACADAGVSFSDITWTRWNMNRAVGRGTLNVNTCEPTCAAGNVETYPVRLRLSNTATGPGKGTFVSTFTTLRGTFGQDAGPALATASVWRLDNPISD